MTDQEKLDKFKGFVYKGTPPDAECPYDKDGIFIEGGGIEPCDSFGQGAGCKHKPTCEAYIKLKERFKR